MLEITLDKILVSIAVGCACALFFITMYGVCKK